MDSKERMKKAKLAASIGSAGGGGQRFPCAAIEDDEKHEHRLFDSQRQPLREVASRQCVLLTLKLIMTRFGRIPRKSGKPVDIRILTEVVMTMLYLSRFLCKV
jgi:hypothetical protein